MNMNITIIFSTIVSFILLAVWRGYVLSKLWLWFVVSTFETAPPLGIAQSIGVALMVSFLTHQHKYDDKESEKPTLEKTAEALAYVFLSPALVLLIGWAVKGFIQ